MKLNALMIRRYKSSCHGWESFEAGEKTKPLLIQLVNILDKLEPQGYDNLHTIWVKLKRPTFRQFYDYYYAYDLPYKKAVDLDLDRARDDYEESYPEPYVWFTLSTKHFKDSRREFYALFIDNTYVFSINDCNSHQEYDDEDLLKWAINEAEATIQAVKSGTYQSLVLDKIPYRYQEGRIRRKDYWEINPKAKESFFTPYKKKEIKKFYEYFISEEPGNPLFSEMTARVFYEACAIVYNSLGMQKENRDYRFKEIDSERERYNTTQTPKEKYYSIADCRDDGLVNVPLDDPKAFELWSDHQGPYYESNGHHPWEIIPSMSISFSMHLYPVKDEKELYHFIISGESEPRAPQTIIAANALYELGYPVEVQALETIIRRIEGKDYVKIVQNDEYCFYDSYIHLPEGTLGEAIAKKAEWNTKKMNLELKDKN